jgi:hypothetical protein
MTPALWHVCAVFQALRRLPDHNRRAGLTILEKKYCTLIANPAKGSFLALASNSTNPA